MDKETVLITGATGFIGSHVTKEVVATGKYKVVAIVRETKDYKNTDELSRNGVHLIKGLFYDEQVLEALFKNYRVGHVIHLAALRGAGLADESAYYKVNVLGTEKLLKCALSNSVKKFVFCSTVGVFGTIPAGVPAGLDTPTAGDTAYHRSKVSAEEKVLGYFEKGLDAYIIRPAIVYGSGDRGFPIRLISMVCKHRLYLPTRDIKIHLLYVNGLSNVITRILEAEGLTERIFIAADREPILFHELVDVIHNYYFKKRYPRHFRIPSFLYQLAATLFKTIGNEKWESRASWLCKNWYYDISRTCSSLNYVPFDTREMFNAYLSNSGKVSSRNG